MTKEHREHLAEGARKRLTQTKQDLRKVQNKFQKEVGEKELSSQVGGWGRFFQYLHTPMFAAVSFLIYPVVVVLKTVAFWNGVERERSAIITLWLRYEVFIF